MDRKRAGSQDLADMVEHDMAWSRNIVQSYDSSEQALDYIR